MSHSIQPSPDYPKNKLVAWPGAFFLMLGLAGFIMSSGAQGADPSDTFYGYQAFNTGNGFYDTAIGDQALSHNASGGDDNTGIGAFALNFNTTGTSNTATGYHALSFNTSGYGNTATGNEALESNTFGAYNTATGYLALTNNTAGGNTANGAQALQANTTGHDNTAVGSISLNANTTGRSNTAVGYQSLFRNTTGSNNTAVGDTALSTGNGSDNTATGSSVLFYNQGNNNTGNGSLALLNNTGSDNTASGFSAMYSNAGGTGNVAAGSKALYSNTSGGNNVGFGINALYSNKAGNFNTAGGTQALQSTTSGNNTGFGFWALLNNSTGSNNVALGYQAGSNLTTGSNNIDIGAPGTAGEANTIRLGKSGTQQKAFVAGIYGKTVATGVGVIIGSNGQLGTVQSSARYKDQIKPMDKASEAILGLKPVTFHYKHELDPSATPQFGLIAEEVEKVNSDLVVKDEGGKVTTVRYEAVNAMLLNEFLKEHAKVAELKDVTQKQQAALAQQQKQIEDLTAGLRKVGAAVAAQAGGVMSVAARP